MLISRGTNTSQSSYPFSLEWYNDTFVEIKSCWIRTGRINVHLRESIDH